jgi:hypothetical protein
MGLGQDLSPATPLYFILDQAPMIIQATTYAYANPGKLDWTEGGSAQCFHVCAFWLVGHDSWVIRVLHSHNLTALSLTKEMERQKSHIFTATSCWSDEFSLPR